jgi:hypothetical protein
MKRSMNLELNVKRGKEKRKKLNKEVNEDKVI